jgi:D-alanyl-D-alanine carboxypeptidase (penicillin-binding protein 5/6)
MPLSRRQIYRRRRLTVFGGIALVLAIGFYLPTTLLAPLSAESATVLPYTAPETTAAAVTMPTYGASAIGAVGFDGVLASGGSADALPMASISKVITALVILEAKPLDVDESGPDITFTSADVELYNHYLALNGSLEPVKSGLVLSELQVLQLMLIPSANNYAASLVNWAFGSQEAFVPVAEAWLAENGMTSTTVVEPTGIDPANVSTATDLVMLGKLALASPVVTKIVSTESAKIPGVGTVENSNDLLGVDGIDGLKTGTLEDFGANLLFTASYTVGVNTIRVVGVVLGGTDHPTIDDDIQAFLTAVEAGFQEIPLTTKGTSYGSVTTDWGTTAQLVAATSTTTLVYGEQPISALVTTDPLTLGKTGDDVGILHITVGDEAVDVDLELDTDISDPGPVWRLTHPAELF